MVSLKKIWEEDREGFLLWLLYIAFIIASVAIVLRVQRMPWDLCLGIRVPSMVCCRRIDRGR